MGNNGVSVHPTAVVSNSAKLGMGVQIGPFSQVGENVSIGKNTKIEAHVSITGWTEIGEDCHFSPYSSIGTEPQDVSYEGEKTRLIIGNKNVFREFMTVNRGTVKGGGVTLIGDNNYFMAYSHIAHDCRVGNSVVFMNGATLAGHVTVDDYATVSAFSGIHQFCRLGKFSYIGGYSVITQDVCPFCRVAGSRPLRMYGLNAIGLRRKGYSKERIHNLKKIFKIIFYSDLNTSQAVKKILEEFPPHEDRDEIVNFIKNSKRGIAKRTVEPWENDLE